ncbi:MAG: amino acid adenylation domain-containing protein, partial [bacterium]|nr:amino acid adenylation domain-containing protein [bacterium]
MDEYGDNILKKLTPLFHPGMRVLEVGCASGISMYRIAPQVGFYFGSDLSSVIIEKNRQQVEAEEHDNIALACLPAHEIDHIKETDFDLVIINSVIQCFHGHNYLRRMLSLALDKIGDRGILFIGDIMDQDLKGELIDDLVRFRKENKGKNYKTKTDWSEELFISRSFLEDFMKDNREIRHIDFSTKIFTLENELTKFRYDALLHIDKTCDGATDGASGAKSVPRHKRQHDLRVLDRYLGGEVNVCCPPDTPAYVIYTSGSTGTPRGVVVEHRNVVRLVKNTDYIRFDKGDRILQTGALAFDASTFEIWGALLNGLELHLAGRDILLTPGRLKESLRKYEISTMWMTSPLFSRMVEEDVEIFAGLGNLLVGGDVLSPVHIGQVRKRFPALTIINGYGPTENTTFSTTFAIAGEFSGSIPIGKPIANSTAYIVDKYGSPVPIGIAGELLVGGDGVALGYLNRPELTAEKFKSVTLRISEDHGVTETLYSTGDLARWLPDGNIEFLGRIDFQVKVRGYRIEPGEIEFKLERCDGIADCTVVARTDELGGRYLCAYFVPDGDIEISVIKDFLALQLPDYMIPSYFTAMETLPLNPNGKIDRTKLPDPTLQLDVNLIAPRDRVERTLAETWAAVLGITKEVIGIDSNFFDLGGHSLKATALVSRMHKELNVKVPLAEIFKTPTIRELAGYIEGMETFKYFTIESEEEKESYPLSSAQKRLYILQQMEDESISYNVPRFFVLESEGGLSIKKLEETFQKLIQRHEGLRTSFHMQDGEPVQKIHEQVEFKIEEIGNAGVAGAVVHDTALIGSFVRPFDLAKAPLLRVAVIKPADSSGKSHTGLILALDMHHIITDGTSMGIFEKDFAQLFGGRELPPLSTRYRDFAAWMNSDKKKEAMRRQENYWLQTFAGELPVLNMPPDLKRPAVQSFEGRVIDFVLGKEVTAKLRKVAKELQATHFITLLAVFDVFLSKICGQEDIVVGTPVAGRRHQDLEQIIGMFINTLALRNFPQGGKGFPTFLKEVKERTVDAFDNQDYPFEELVEKVAVNRDMSRNPVFDVMFALHNQIEPQAGTEESGTTAGLKLEPYQYENTVSRFDLSFHGIEEADRFVFSVEYCTKLFKEETIRLFFKYFTNVLVSILDNPQRHINAIDILDEKEKRRVSDMCSGKQEDLPAGQTIDQLFEQQVQKSGESIALKGHWLTAPAKDAALTYNELNEKANQLAQQLKEKGVGPDVIVGLMVARSLEMIIGIIAILKAGGACLPIDPALPEDRKLYMLKDSGARLLVVAVPPAARGVAPGPHQGEALPTPRGGALGTPIALRAVNEYRGFEMGERGVIVPRETPRTGDGLSRLCYVIYTSGSTGIPKGVMLEHRTLVNLIDYQYKYTNIDFSCVLQFTSISFDVSFQEIFSTLLAGGELVLIKEDIRNNVERLFAIADERQVRTLFLPTAFLKFIMNNKSIATPVATSVDHIVTAGEQLIVSARFKQYLQENHIHLHNHYGPAEAHVVAVLTMPPDMDIPYIPSIGRPVMNTGIYILDKQGALQPVNIPGELVINGVQVGRGYLNKPGLTAGRFVDYDLQITKPASPGITGIDSESSTPSRYSTVYKTGDLARLLPDGNIEFLGRIDHQVKIRGFRVEPGEIETRLLNYEAVKEAVVLVKEDEGGDKSLCAYIALTEQEEESTGVAELRTYLSRCLPDYMVPAYFIMLEKIPLTPNGKIDRKALSLLTISNFQSQTEYTAPRNHTEKLLVEIWSEVLGLHTAPDAATNLKRHPSSTARRAIGVLRGAPPSWGPGATPLAAGGKKLGIYDNFFQLGGHSLKAAVLAAEIHKRFNVKMPAAVVFKEPTIAGLAEYIKDAAREEFTPLQPVDKKEYYQLSSAQKRLFFLQGMELENTVYNMPGAVELKGELDVHKLREIFSRLISRHESLRTSFHMIAETPVQRIHDTVDFEIPYSDSTAEATGGDANTGAQVRAFDLAKAPLLRVELEKTGENIHIMTIDMHHIISDGTSFRVLVKEFMALAAGEQLPPLNLQYKDFSLWQNIEKSGFNRQEDYWLSELAGELPLTALPTDFSRPAVKSFEGDAAAFTIGPRESAALKELALKSDATLFMVLLALFNVMLARLSGSEDVIIGTPVAGRRHADLQQILGMFVNTLALRNYPVADKTFLHFLEEVKGGTLSALENQEYQFEDLVEKMDLERDPSRNPLFDVMLSLQNFDIPQIEIPGLQLRECGAGNRVARLDLSLEVSEHGETINLRIEYSVKLFTKETIERFAGYFKNLAASAALEPQCRLLDMEIMGPEEKKRILYDFNDTQTEFPHQKTLHQLFRQQVETNGRRIAVRYLDDVLTYRRLDAKAEQLAAVLIEKGVRQNTIVAIKTERSVGMMVGIMGILKAGAAYLPIDPTAPRQRIAYMLKDSCVELMVISKDSQLPVEGENYGVEYIGELGIVNCKAPDIYQKPYSPTPPTHPEQQPCYIIYTSGTTGKPKGVIVEHRSAVNITNWFVEQYRPGPGTNMLLMSDYSFDASINQIFGSLLSGASLNICPAELLTDIEGLREFIDKYQINIIYFVPVLLKELLGAGDKLESLRLVMSGADRLDEDAKDKILENYQLFNHYGPTEATVDILAWKCEAGKVTLGKPINNYRCYILDKHGNVLPVGAVGELFAAGEGIARGYLNKPELTADKFRETFLRTTQEGQKSSLSGEPLGVHPAPRRLSKIYNTGDLVRWLPDGRIEFLGRSDSQVKIRG